MLLSQPPRKPLASDNDTQKELSPGSEKHARTPSPGPHQATSNPRAAVVGMQGAGAQDAPAQLGEAKEQGGACCPPPSRLQAPLSLLESEDGETP